MKVLYFGTLNYIAGGPAMSSYLTIKGLREQKVDAQISMFTLSKNAILRGKEIPINYCSAPWENKFCYSPYLKKELATINNVDIYHAQGVWQYPTYALIDVSKKKDRPYIISPRGMLYPQDITKSSTILKHFSLKWRLMRDLNSAACIHTTCEEEMRYCRELGVVSPIAVIPNPVEVKDYPTLITPRVFTLGYIGRLSKRKNIESLIYAFSKLRLKRSEAKLLIIGGGDSQYEEFLRSEVLRLQLDNVTFCGFLSGREKEQALAKISVLAMPSNFENFGNVILEGLVRGIPCIATKGAPWKDLIDYNCGWWVDYNQYSITKAIRDAINTPKYELKKMGDNGKLLMAKKYSVESVASQMNSLYQWILGDKERPDFVFL
ncbi:glycosyltransferase [Prevotella sp. KH2C16]|uniref:glycosyltransferase n=1 Tax=Prevotella sp. KH2C16 TaxID=1855325 RepID=UPI0008EDC8DA|nr:glycosyltransferase [Prevotella sp. KH2C16]SFG08891.1 Glycosyltransferase involved in cell wall bisynthesis [Prevotella sp. KH2C16]